MQSNCFNFDLLMATPGKLWLLLMLCYQIVDCSVIVGPIVESKAGVIQGLVAPDGDYYKFLGIPYAVLDPDNPFGDSKPHPRLEGVYQAFDDSTICPQYDIHSKKIDGSLDCLMLSVYVPQRAFNRTKLAVMVWIHEGGFKQGYIGRDPMKAKYLMKQDIILVMLNYRLGPYGFMCLDIPEVPGNQGLKDQVLALKWIRNNIESFGGDSNRITLFGSSAGAMSIDFHIKYTDGSLFHRGILQSGSSVSSTVIILPDKQAPLKLAEYLGMSTDSLTRALSFLATLDPKLVIQACSDLRLIFKPCIEKKLTGVEPYITESWINVKQFIVKAKQVILGIAEYEKVYEFKVNPETYISGIDIFRDSLLSTFNFNDHNLIRMRNLVKQFYLGDKQISEDNMMPLINFSSDFTYIYSMHRAMKQYLDGGVEQIYRYMFSYAGDRNYNQAIGNFTFNGAIHADELGYIFEYDLVAGKRSIEDQVMIDRMTTLFANFAKYGNPTPVKTSLLPVEWIPVSRDHVNFLKISSNLTLTDSLLHHRMAFWDIFYMLNEKYQKLYAHIKSPSPNLPLNSKLNSERVTSISS